jgi:hypothetical protein
MALGLGAHVGAEGARKRASKTTFVMTITNQLNSEYRRTNLATKNRLGSV